MKRDRLAQCEVHGTMIHGYATACVNLKIVAGLRALENTSDLDPMQWYPLEYFVDLEKLVCRSYQHPAPILETVGATMMTGWYNFGPGKDVVKRGVDFLRFQSGSDGYASVIRGPKDVVGRFDLLSVDEDKGTALVHSTTPFSRDIERGVILGGVSAPGDILYIDVNNDRRADYFRIDFFRAQKEDSQEFEKVLAAQSLHRPVVLQQDEQTELYWRHRGLQKQWQRASAFWAATNESLSQAYNELDSQSLELAEVSHRAGMADVASDVIHNIGNSLNSLNSSVEKVANGIEQSHVDGLLQANSLLETQADVARFFESDPKGRLLPQYYQKIGKTLEQENCVAREEVERIRKIVHDIHRVIETQQTAAELEAKAEELNVVSVLEDALELQHSSFEQKSIQVEKNYSDSSVFVVTATKPRLIRVFLEILKNAAEAVKENSQQRAVRIDLVRREDRVQIQVADNGVGIALADLPNVFHHGYTTKGGPRGFGLHNCANYIREIGGAIDVKSSGFGQGTTATISLVRMGE